ncbi:MAG: DUF1015 domain-containing protein [Clostridia bacterium]|nr:DUF1015 domain-containing protein [Clostridia bacterium]
MNYQKIGFYPAEILIPQHTDMKKWSVVACDQYTSQPEYWARVREFVGEAPSTLKLMQPEAELTATNSAMINATMKEYLQNGIFRTLENSMIYIKRTLADGKIRQGLIGALDLECYDYRKGAISLCRATEGTVEDRLPPRIKIREGAPLEMPHIMVLIDDPAYTVIEALDERRQEFQKVYDFMLMELGGRIRGYAIKEEQCASIMEKLAALAGEAEKPLLYAVGDGNHSLATAKACYARIKEQLGDAALDHPARYCLVELVNVHSPALEFEPIHRIVFHAEGLLEQLKKAGLEEGTAHPQQIEVVQKGVRTTWSFGKETAKLAVGTLQNALDEYLAQSNAEIDYIHGSEVVEELSMQDNAIGFILPEMGKEELFPTVVSDGALPRKTFSMGHPHDKRFYLECRRIDD